MRRLKKNTERKERVGENEIEKKGWGKKGDLIYPFAIN